MCTDHHYLKCNIGYRGIKQRITSGFIRGAKGKNERTCDLFAPAGMNRIPLETISGPDVEFSHKMGEKDEFVRKIAGGDLKFSHKMGEIDLPVRKTPET